MYIESLQLNGWKTYFKPITITGFDRSFNAISGRNGSGKSNILNAVQFVLGSSNKELLRLKSSLIELIYKDGQAGILEAAVTLKLRIPNKILRPFGYQNNETLSITRIIHKDKGSKFFLEGKIIPAGRLKNLLESMHLSVEHSQFIVKQGQITKLASSKPVEILQMIEDAIGTSSYVNSRNDTLDILKKTDSKIKQINFALTNTITPFMDQIKSERALLNVYSMKQKELQEIKERIFPYEYLRTINRIQKLTHTLQEARRTITSNEEEIQSLKLRLVEANKMKQIYSSSVEEVRILKLKLTDAQNEVASKSSQLNHVNRRLQTLRNQFKEGEEQIDQLKHKSERAKKKYLQHEEGFAKMKEELNDKKSKLEQLKNTTNTDMNTFINKQIEDFEKQINRLKVQVEQLASKEKVISRDIDNFNNLKRDGESRVLRRMAEIDKLKSQIEQLKRVESPVQVQNPDAPEFNQRKNALTKEMNDIASNTQNLILRYNDPPVKDFNKQDIKGRVFHCFKIIKEDHYKAIEIGVGGRLHNIVVRNEKASSVLLNYSCFGPSVSIIPNNKIVPKEIPKECLLNMDKIAQQHGGMAKAAYELITYEKQLQPTIKFVFGTFAVVSSKEIGKAIAYNSNKFMRVKCVTLQGEVFDPSGTLSGGYYNFNNFLLLKVINYRKIEDELNAINEKKDGVRREYAQYKQKRDLYDKSKFQLVNKTRELQKLQQEGRQLKTQELNIEDMTEQLESMKQSKKNIHEQIEMLRGKIEKSKGMKNGKDAVNDQKKFIQQQIHSKEAELDQMKKQGSSIFREMEDISYKLKNCQRVLGSSKEIEKIENQSMKIEEQLKELKKVEKSCEWELDEKMSTNDQEKIMKLVQQSKGNQNKIDTLKTDINKHTNSNQDISRQLIELEEERVKVLTKNAWIQVFVAEKHVTLQSYPPDYNFENEKKRYATASGSLETMENKISNLADKDTSFIEAQYESLLKKLDILSNDKESLLKSIKDLDEKRILSIEKSYQLIRSNLIKIFTNLYPVATCNLVPLDPRDVLKGFQITFNLGQVQKFLMQLSGGQKSLLSLSFIFSLLLFRPCPFYFLDEIDAALDQVHTENLGRMIREHFPQSQFIIISLKETMFRNANVLFNVNFVDNTSIVERITKEELQHVQMKNLFNNSEQDENQNYNEGKKKNKKPNKYNR